MSEPMVGISNSSRAFIALLAITALAAATTTIAGAAGTFGVTTTIAASCAVTTSPAALTPSYSASTGVSSGSETTLVTTCNGTAPTVAFTDATGAGTVFKMIGTTSPLNVLNFQISNTLSCTGIVGDVAIPQATVQPLITGSGESYNICVAVIANQLLAASDHYTDTVTYTIAAGT